jgi:hypothetical protein
MQRWVIRLTGEALGGSHLAGRDGRAAHAQAKPQQPASERALRVIESWAARRGDVELVERGSAERTARRMTDWQRHDVAAPDRASKSSTSMRCVGESM